MMREAEREMTASQATFFTLVRSPRERDCARLLVHSIRSFGGPLCRCPVWVFEAQTGGAVWEGAESEGIEIVRFSVPEPLKGYDFADKVCACAQAERLANASRQTLIWFNPECLILRPPERLELAEPHDAAVRPVHIRNVGLLATEPLDAYWSRIYEAVGASEGIGSVLSFVDGQVLRPYFNTHAFSFVPSQGIAARWMECFEVLARDGEFQRRACGDELHQIFLHQAVLSALLLSRMEKGRIRILPEDYNYPYNLHGAIPHQRRARALNDLVSVVYEDRTLAPDRVDDLEVREPLRSWLVAHMGARQPDR